MCRCLRGASRSNRRIPSITALYGSSTDGRGDNGIRGSGHAEFRALRTVRQATLYLRSSARIVMPARWSRRNAAYSSAFDICGMTRTFHREHPYAVLASTPALTKLMNITRPWIRGPPKPRVQLLMQLVNTATQACIRPHTDTIRAALRDR